MDVQFIPFGSDSSYLYDAVRIYATVWQRNREDALMFFRKYASYAYFRGYVARVGRESIGMAFGTYSQKGQWWHEKVAQKVGGKHPALQNAWVLTELAVLEEYRNNDIGGELHDLVVAAQPLPNLLLSTQVANVGARRFYERRGWHYLHAGFAFQPRHEPYVIMSRTAHGC